MTADTVWGLAFVGTAVVVIASAYLRARKVTRRPAIVVAVTPAVWSPCNAHRPHVPRLSADHLHWECARSGCGQRWELDQPKSASLPYDQTLDLRNDDWRAWDREVSA